MSLILWYRFVRLKRVPLARHGLKKNKIKKVIDEEEKKEEGAAHVYGVNHLSELPSNVCTYGPANRRWTCFKTETSFCFLDPSHLSPCTALGDYIT